MLPPPNAATKKLFNDPGLTNKLALVNPVLIPSVTVIVVVSDFFNVVVNTENDFPLAKVTAVI